MVKKISFIQSPRNATPGGEHRDLPGVVLYNWRTDTPQTPVPQMCLVCGGWKITLPFALSYIAGGNTRRIGYRANGLNGTWTSVRVQLDPPDLIYTVHCNFFPLRKRNVPGMVRFLRSWAPDRSGERSPKTGPSNAGRVGTTVIAMWIPPE